MRPKKKRVGHEQPDTAKEEEIVDTLGGTDGEGIGDDEDWGRTEPDLDYGRLLDEETEEDKPI